MTLRSILNKIKKTNRPVTKPKTKVQVTRKSTPRPTNIRNIA